ncbi:helix-turn-helix transcriptional regulator [Falsihalocynthiibacter sp. BN13B15]|uniref:helix-turn-helix transcriptional regulator n=1 Tax=Falsihalocynthiibacter sp. BN13B15 TaxID=3240871 RepID=UPI00350FDA26
MSDKDKNTATPLASYPERLLTIHEASDMTSKPISSIYRDINRGRFPLPVQDTGARRWVLSELVQHIEGLKAQRDAVSAA